VHLLGKDVNNKAYGIVAMRQYMGTLFMEFKNIPTQFLQVNQLPLHIPYKCKYNLNNVVVCPLISLMYTLVESYDPYRCTQNNKGLIKLLDNCYPFKYTGK